MVNALPFIRQPGQNGKKASDVSAADWQYQIHVKNYRYFTRVQFDFSQGSKWRSPNILSISIGANLITIFSS